MWNYRIIKNRGNTLNICEVYYGCNKNIVAFSEPLAPSGDTLEDLKQYFILQMLAFDKPILSIADDGHTLFNDKTIKQKSFSKGFYLMAKKIFRAHNFFKIHNK